MPNIIFNIPLHFTDITNKRIQPHLCFAYSRISNNILTKNVLISLSTLSDQEVNFKNIS